MNILIVPIVFGLLLLAYIALEELCSKPMARPLSKRELRQRYRQRCDTPLPVTIKMRALLAEAKTHYL